MLRWYLTPGNNEQGRRLVRPQKLETMNNKKPIATPEVAIEKKPNATPEVAIEKNIETILKLEKDLVKGRSTAEHIADKVTTFAGSSPFILLHVLWFGGWILFNEGLIPGIQPIDKFPYSFLTLIVSLEAIFLTLLVLMSQNRMAIEADHRAKLDLQINMLDEQETTIILKTVQNIAQHLGLKLEVKESTKGLFEETDLHQVAASLEKKSEKHPKKIKDKT